MQIGYKTQRVSHSMGTGGFFPGDKAAGA